jgi:hypothetical protein
MGEVKMESLKNFLSGFRKGSHSFGAAVATAVNTVILTLVYFLAVGPTSLAAKAAKKEFLNLSLQERETYWEELSLEKKGMEDFYRQF